MTVKKRDPIVEANEVIYAALEPLSDADRTRVLASVRALLGMQPVGVDSPRNDRTQSAEHSRGSQEVSAGSRRVGITELVSEKKPSTNVQKITLFAYYRDKYESNGRFSRDDLRAYFPKAKEHPPSNYDRDFVKTVKTGWIHEDGDDSYITTKGIEAVESAFQREQGNGAPARARTTSRKKRGAKAARTRESVGAQKDTTSKRATTPNRTRKKLK